MQFKPLYRPRNLLILSIIIFIVAILFNPNLAEFTGTILGIALIIWIYNKIRKIDYDYEEEEEY